MVYIDCLVHEKHISCKQVPVVADNTDYVLRFEFVGEWDNYPEKYAILVDNTENKFYKLELLDNSTEVPLPKFTVPKIFSVGVTAYNGQDQISTDPSIIRISPSILTGVTEIISSPEQDDVLSEYYARYNALIDKFSDTLTAVEDKQLYKAVLYTAQSLTEEQQAQARANIGAGTPYTLPEASSDALGGVKADAAETADTQPVRKGTDGKLYTAPGVGTSIGITGASAGQIPKVKSVDASGAPTEWKAEKDTTPFIVTVGGESSGYTSSHTFDEIVAAASAGRVVMAYSDYINFPQVGKNLYGVYFNLDSTQDVAVFVYIDPHNMIKYTFAVDPFSISASASYLSATSSTFGGVKADSAESTDTQPVRIGGDGKLYTAPGSGGGADISLGISGATAGQVAKVKTVDASGAPTAWEAGDAAGGGSEWTRLGDVTVSQTAEFVPLSFSNGIVTIDTNADGYASLPSSGTIGCIVHTIDVKTKAIPVVGILQTDDYSAGTFKFLNRDWTFQSSAAYDPSTYKISIANVAMVVMENIPTDYKRYKCRVTTPVYSNHGLRQRYTCEGFTEIGCGSNQSTNMGGGAIIETEFYPHPYDENYVYRRVRIAYGKFYDGGSGNEFQSFELVDSGSGKTKPQVSGEISFKAMNMIFVNGTRFELWGTNDD